ncbi:MAG TPA: DUF6600 domain-containing protein [Chthoniobacteraceae bacterium]|jgi:hypothetical protein|nr:DUF6600 domain-containing protein [Chthoniobacteraceae bacterium]
MRILLTLLAAALLVSPLAPSAQAKDVSVEFFYESLDPYGEWIQTADYGYVFHPKDVQEDWRPYTDGSWAFTDAGWTWVSEEPFGGITYHYGRWTRLQNTGWVWVPDTEWAPAWVSWRRSEQYVGWAPLPPEATFKRDVGISSWSDSYYDVGPSQYTFVAGRDFGAPRLSKVILPRRENVTIIRETKNITNITYTSGGIYNDGPQYSVISRESREPVRRLRLERRDDVVFEGHRVRDEGMRMTIAGDSLRVFAPAVSFRTEAAPQRVGRHVEKVEVDRGWRDVPQSQELRVKIQQDTPRAPANLPKQPSFTRATAALGLTDNASRKGNLDPEGKPREREGRATATTGAPEQGRTPAENPKPGERPRTAVEGNVPPNGRKPATGDLKPGQGRPQPATTEPAPGAPRTAREGNEPGAPRTGKPGEPTTTAPGREGVKPSTTTRPEGAPESREGKPNTLAPDGPRNVKPNTTAPGREGVKPATTTRPEGAPESREGKPNNLVPDAPRSGKPNTTAPGREGVKPPTTTRPEGAPEAREGKPNTLAPDGPRNGKPNTTAPGREGVKPANTRPEGAPESREGKPEAARGSKEPKVSAPGGEPARPRTEGGAPEGARRPEGGPPREGAAPAHRPGAPAATPATEVKGKKGDKDKDKDKEKGQ